MPNEVIRSLDSRFRIRTLTPRDVADVASVEALTFPPTMRYGKSWLEDIVIVPFIKGRNLSFGIYTGSSLVAYAIADVRGSAYEPGRKALFVVSMAILPEYRRRLTVVMLAEMARRAWLLDLDVEGEYRDSTSFVMVMRHGRMLSRGGARVVRYDEIDPIEGERQYRVRIDLERGESRGPRRWAARFRARSVLTWRTAVRIPLRIARQVLIRLPDDAVPRSLLRAAYLRSD